MKTFLQYFVIFVVSICLVSASSYILGVGIERNLIVFLIVGFFMLATSFVAWIVLLDEIFELNF